MRKDILLGIGATLIAMALFYFADNPTAKLNIGKNKIDSDAEMDIPANKRILNRPVESESLSQNPIASATIVTNAEKEIIGRNFAERLKEIGNCLKIQNAIDSPIIDPSYDNLLVSLRPALGELVVQMDDWTQFDLQAPDGSRKRLRTEVNYDNPNAPVKYVQFFNINEQGFPEMQTLDPEKSRNPTDDYINYLKAGSNIVLDERGSRAYFQEGEEVVIIERSNLMQSLSITKNGRTVSCTSLDVQGSNCQCVE